MKITCIAGLSLKETHVLSDDGLFYVMKEQYAVPYRASVQKQLETWLAGKPEHNHFSDECCPDFSCCHPEMLWSEDARKAFATSSEKRREMLLLKGLNRIKTDAWLMEKLEESVQTGDDANRDYFNMWTSGGGSTH